jgi:hypothetical protein
MNTTQVPTEWLEELKKLADKASEVMFDMICKEKVDHKNIIYIAQFCGQAKGAKYFQPQPDSVDLINPSELLIFVKNHYEGSFYTFSEVLEAFKKSKSK